VEPSVQLRAYTRKGHQHHQAHAQQRHRAPEARRQWGVGVDQKHDY
jgi:hypothetical protein